MKNNFVYKILAVLLLASMVLSACGGAKPAATEASVVTEAPVGATVAPATEAPMVKPSGKITVWSWVAYAFKDTGLMDEFKAEYPDIEVEFVDYKSGDVYQKLGLAISAGSGAPDVVQVEGSNIGGFIEMNGLTDLTPWVKDSYLKEMSQFKWADVERDGKYYGMPWDSGPVVAYYRRDVFEKAGLSTDPAEVSKMFATWDSYLETCKEIKTKTGLACFSSSKANNNARLYEMMLWQQGMGYYDADGKVTIDSPENIATLEKLGEFWTADVTSETAPWTDPWYAEFASPDESVATIVEAAWMGQFLKSWIAADTAGKWGVAYMPAFKEGQVRSANDGGSNLVIPEQSQNKEAAWAFIQFMLGRKENQIKQFEQFDLFPTIESAFTDPVFQKPDPFFADQKTREIYADVAAQIPVAYIYGPYYTAMNGHVALAVQEYATGLKTAEEALQDAAEAVRNETGMP